MSVQDDEHPFIPAIAVGVVDNYPADIHIVSESNQAEHAHPPVLNLDEQWRAAMAEMNDDLGAEEEEEEEDEEVSLPAEVPLGRDDPERMILTSSERQWAMQIKAAIEQDQELDNLTDFQYAQMALVEPKPDGGGDDTLKKIESVLERAYQLQEFRHDKRLLGTASQARQLFQETSKLFPGWQLAFYYNEADGGYTYVFDSTKLVSSTFGSNQRAFDSWVSMMYYVLHAASPDFEAIRKGIAFHVECEGFDSFKHFGIKVFSRAWTELGGSYPIHFRGLKHFHTSVFKNLLVSMAKRFVPSEIHKKFEVGCVCELGRLDQIFLVPNQAAASQRFQESLIDCLERKLVNEEEFSL